MHLIVFNTPYDTEYCAQNCVNTVYCILIAFIIPGMLTILPNIIHYSQYILHYNSLISKYFNFILEFQWETRQKIFDYPRSA